MMVMQQTSDHQSALGSYAIAIHHRADIGIIDRNVQLRAGCRMLYSGIAVCHIMSHSFVRACGVKLGTASPHENL